MHVVGVVVIIINQTEEEEQSCRHNVEFQFGWANLRAEDPSKGRCVINSCTFWCGAQESEMKIKGE